MRNVPVSVIIPSFNAACYLEACLSAVEAGTPPAEILIVDDCSTDGSLQMARELGLRYPNVRVLAREINGGAIEARRDGVHAATQKWVAFVDTDDLLEPGALADAYRGAQAAHADICIWELWRFDGERSWAMLENLPERFPVTGHEALLLTLGNWRIHSFGVSRRSLYLKAYGEFRESCHTADELLTRLVFRQAQRVSACKSRYYYRVNPASVTINVHPRMLSSLDAALWLIDFCRELPGAPLEEVTANAIWQAWWLYQRRAALGPAATRAKIAGFLAQLVHRGALSRQLLRRPKSLAKLALLTATCAPTLPGFRRSPDASAVGGEHP
ncbi:hypothetical protein GMLC_25760 [Geomonas limicola]|uniref:Glycosyltransferase 2-like domain-containing protein n=1 Tax=Geomonas limicola TaxID=2740186 RepID=A0A6V8NB08_9BACT|nr:glycosyltransferase family 2 protein [Geomonas limicola]GFO68997.1 hypothetical protein GMLC_25760 [Geomonas limicola]